MSSSMMIIMIIFVTALPRTQKVKKNVNVNQIDFES